jgi:hypothetical protein
MNVGREKITKRGINDLWLNSFSKDPVCDDKIFRSRFGMPRPLFICIVDALGEWSLPISLGEIFLVSRNSHLCRSVQQLFLC